MPAVTLDGDIVGGDWVVFSIITRGGQGARSGSEAVNTVTGAVRDIRDVSLGNLLTVSEPIIVQGVVYRSEVNLKPNGARLVGLGPHRLHPAGRCPRVPVRLTRSPSRRCCAPA